MSPSSRQRPVVTGQWLLSLGVALVVATTVYWALSGPTAVELAVFGAVFGVAYGVVDYLVRRVRQGAR